MVLLPFFKNLQTLVHLLASRDKLSQYPLHPQKFGFQKFQLLIRIYLVPKGHRFPS